MDVSGTLWIYTISGSTFTRDADLVHGKGNVYDIQILGDDTVVLFTTSAPYMFLYAWGSDGSLTELTGNTLVTALTYSMVIGSIDSANNLVWCNADRVPKIVDVAARTTQIIFDTAPAAGVAITADYAVNGIHKTDQYVIDMTLTIQYGEPE